MTRRKRRKGLKLDDYVVERLPFKQKQYTIWDRAVKRCGIRVSADTKSCVISVWLGGSREFETIGRVSPETPYEFLRELAIRRIGELKRGQLPRAPLRHVSSGDNETLRKALENYVAAHPELSERTVKEYGDILERHWKLQMEQPVSLLVAPEILRLNQEHLEALKKVDPVNKPPIGFWAWQSALRTLRTIVGWHAAQKGRPSPWPEKRALPIKAANARLLPVELQTVEGRRRLIEGLKAIDSATANADRFICYSGLRRGAAAGLNQGHLIANGVLEFRSKTRTLRIPLSRQAASLIDPNSQEGLLHVGERRIRRPLIRIFGTRDTPRGRRARVTPHDLRRYFKSVGAELGIDPTIMNLLVGHTVKGVDKSYIAKLRLSVLRAAAQRIADEIDNPQDPLGEDDVILSIPTPPHEPVQSPDSYLRIDALPSLESLRPSRHPHYFKREDLYILVWTAPVVEIAGRIGISDVGLAKACRRAAIPLPGRGYWERVGAGQPIGREALPPPPLGISDIVRITGTRNPQTSAAKSTRTDTGAASLLY